MGCSSVSDAHIYMHHVSSVRDWWKKNESGCSWDVQDAQDALKTDPEYYVPLARESACCTLDSILV